jgi:hypothetical protein
MGQLIEIKPPTEEQHKEWVKKQKEKLKLLLYKDEYYNIFESGDDQYVWMKYYREKRYRESQIQKWGYDPGKPVMPGFPT